MRQVATLIILIFLSSCAADEPSSSKVIVVNKYGENISIGYLGFCRDKLPLDKLKKDEKIEFEILNECDGPYSVDIVFIDGSTVKEAGGYSIVGIPVTDTIIISKESILLRRNCETKLASTESNCTKVYW